MSNKNTSNSKVSNGKTFNVNPSFGLTNEQVQQRIDEKLTNNKPKHVTKSVYKIIYDNLVNFFNILLFSIAALMIVAQLPISSFLFLGILILNIGIGLFQDFKARHLVSKLEVVAAPKVKVIRNGEERLIESEEVVVSDIVILSSGEQIVVDGEIVEGQIEANESMLTGESNEIKKQTGSRVYSGSFVVSGVAKMRVTHVGKQCYAEKITTKARSFARPKSMILKSISAIFRYVGIATIVIGLGLIITAITKGELVWPADGVVMNSSFQNSVKTISGSLVSMIPTGMYLLVSTSLTVGVIRLSTKKVLVQELYCLETLARADVVCFDKTGTLTDGTLNVVDLVLFGKNKTQEVGSILKTLVIATKDNNVTARAISEHYKDFHTLDFLDGIGFNSKRKYSAVRLRNGITCVLGAREFLNIKSEDVDKVCSFQELKGNRVLVLASTKKPIDPDANLPVLEPIGVIVFQDHIKDDCYKTIEWFKNNGVDMRVISGDSALAVSKIAEKAGIENANKYISLEGISLAETALLAKQYKVFGRVSPEQKEVIISTLREAGHVVAMTGDGVNDILALKSADCSIAMANGSQAAKSVSNLVMLDSNFSGLPNVVSEGRRVINNLQRVASLFLVKTAFAIILSAFVLVLSWMQFDIKYPFGTNNMYLWELFSIGFASFFLSLQPNNEQIKGSFLPNILKRVLPAALTSISMVLIFYIMYYLEGNSGLLVENAALTMSVLAFSAFSFVFLFRVCRKFDAYKTVLFIALVIITGGLIVYDFYHADPVTGQSLLLHIYYSSLTETNWFILPIVFGISIPVYYVLDLLFKNIFDEGVKKNENF